MSWPIRPMTPLTASTWLSHAWAAATASPMLIRARALPELIVYVAESGPLIAMKLQSIMNRGAAKEATDLLDIIRLSLDRDAGPVSRAQLGSAESQLRQDAALHAQRWFDDHAARSLRLIRAIPEGRDTGLDDLRLVSELLHSALRPAPGA